MNKSTFRGLTLSAVFAALLCVTAPFSVQIGTVPVSLATFSVYLTALVLSPTQAVGAAACYLVLGAVGLPVFAGFFGGFSRIMSPSGGFLIGYIPCAFAASFLSRRIRNRGRMKVLISAASAVCGSAVCHVCGVLWFMLVTHGSLADALAVCVIPFAVPETVKIALASYLASLLDERLKRFEYVLNNNIKIDGKSRQKSRRD